MQDLKRIIIDIHQNGITVAGLSKEVCASALVIPIDAEVSAHVDPFAAATQIAGMLGIDSRVTALDKGSPTETTSGPAEEEEEDPGGERTNYGTTGLDEMDKYDGSQPPLLPITSATREAALKWLASRDIEPKKGTKNPTLTKLIKAELTKGSTGAEEETATDPNYTEDAVANDDECPMCKGTGILCPSAPETIQCSLCGGEGATDVKLSGPALRLMGGTVLGTLEKGGEQYNAAAKSLQDSLVELKVKSVTQVPADKVGEACAVLLTNLDAVFATPEGEKEKEADEWSM